MTVVTPVEVESEMAKSKNYQRRHFVVLIVSLILVGLFGLFIADTVLIFKKNDESSLTQRLEQLEYSFETLTTELSEFKVKNSKTVQYYDEELIKVHTKLDSLTAEFGEFVSETTEYLESIEPSREPTNQTCALLHTEYDYKLDLIEDQISQLYDRTELLQSQVEKDEEAIETMEIKLEKAELKNNQTHNEFIEHFSWVDGWIKQLGDHIDSIEAENYRAHSEINEHLGWIDGWIGGINGHLGVHDNQIGQLFYQTEQLRNLTTNLTERLDSLEELQTNYSFMSAATGDDYPVIRNNTELIFTDIVYDSGSAVSPNGTFTAPVHGLYRFEIQVMIHNL